MFNLYTLDNGLRVVTEYIEHVNSISVGIMVQNGSRNETKDENGISHFIEHMFFKGTDKRNAKEIVQEIENIVGEQKLEELTTINPKLAVNNKRIEIEEPEELTLTWKEKLMMFIKR